MKESLKENLQTVFLTCILGTYIVMSSFSFFTGLSAETFTIPFRVFIFCYSLFLISINYKNFIGKKHIYFFAGFWIFYFIKTYFSFHNDVYDKGFNVFFKEIYIRIFVNVLIPSLAILSLNYQIINYRKLIYSIYIIMFSMLFINFLNIVDTNMYKGSLGIFAIYYISYGHLGVTLAALSLYFFIFQENKTLGDKIIFIVGFILGTYTVLNGGARSPLLAYIIITIFLGLLWRNKFFLYTIGICLVLFVVLLFYNNHSGIPILDRTYTSVFEGNTSEREPLFKRSINIFMQNPIFGGRTLYENGMYPHNLFLELLMATGILGTFMYILYYFPFLKNVSWFLNFNRSKFLILPFFIIFLQYFVLSLTSYSLFGNLEFCYYGAFVVSIIHKNFITQNYSPQQLF